MNRKVAKNRSVPENQSKIALSPSVQPGATRRKKKLNELITDSGFVIKKVPSPWLLYASTINKEEIRYQFQIGKKTDFPVELAFDFSVRKLDDDQFLKDYWIGKPEW